MSFSANCPPCALQRQADAPRGSNQPIKLCSQNKGADVSEKF